MDATLASGVLLAVAAGLMGATPEGDEALTGSAGVPPLDPRRLEVGVLPAINYDSDLGMGLGALAALAQFDPDVAPFAWRVQTLAFLTLRDAGNGLEAPYQDFYVRLDHPELFVPALRVNGEIAFRRFGNTGYHGFGSRSVRAQRGDPGFPTDGAVSAFHVYERIYPTARLVARYQLVDEPTRVGKQRLELFVGTRLTYNDLSIASGSALARDIARLDEASESGRTLRRLLRGTDDHLLWLIAAGLLLDTRDHEFVPSRGTLSELAVRFSPGVAEDLVFAGFTLQSAWFWSLYREQLVLAARVALDAQVGRVPFYEQTRIGTLEPSDAPGGGGAVRGVLRQRFAGPLQALGNLELRARILPFEVLAQRFELGVTGFVDVGRVWAGVDSLRIDGARLDGPLGDFAVGAGGGIRMRWGDTFVIRADLAHAPTEGTTGLYIDVGQVF